MRAPLTSQDQANQRGSFFVRLSMIIDRNIVDHFLLCGLIARAERTLAESKGAGYQGRATAEMEELLGKLYDERRILMEDMMRVPLDRAGV